MIRRTLPTVLALLVTAALVLPISAAAQSDIVYPLELYCGENFVSIALESGIRHVQVLSASPNILVRGAGGGSCETADTLRILVLDPGPGTTKLQITDCRNRVFLRTLETRSWNIDENRLGTVRLGDTSCFQFKIQANVLTGTGGLPFYVDSITVTDPRVLLRLPGPMPVRVNPGQTYRYTVCFASNEVGTFRFPVITWVRRTYPSGGLTTYPVADTGLLTVVRPRPRDTSRTTPPPPDTARIVEILEQPEQPITDPTTFRSVAVPNAIIPRSGRFFAGSYDLLGLIAGYAVTDHLMVMAAGAIPTPDDWGGIHGDIFGAYSIGLKAGMALDENMHIAAGYQFGRSFYDREHVDADTVQSSITVHAPYVALSFGDDDSRFSATLGYAFKHHSKPNEEFDRDALVFAVGGDTRIARNWKLAGELIRMETVGVMPVIGTVRYFTERFAIDAGVAYVGITTGDTPSPKIPVAPVISAIVVF